MNDEIKKDRSPNYPKLALAEALDMVKTLYQKAGKAKLSPLAAVGVWGYSGLNGAALTMLGTLTAYGLLTRERGAGLCVSPLAIALIHPTDQTQERLDKAQAALMPKVFEQLYSEGFRNADESVVCNHLIQSGFTPDGANVAAEVYTANFSFAELDKFSSNAEMKRDQGIETGLDIARKVYTNAPPEHRSTMTPPVAPPQSGWVFPNPVREKPILETFIVPLGENQATITFSGNSLSEEDFDALGEYVELFKKQFKRKRLANTTPEDVIEKLVRESTP